METSPVILAPAEAQSSRPRDLALDLLRIAAIIAVVVLHVSNQHCREAFPGVNWLIRITSDALVRWCVPVFLMISGALFLDPARRVTLRHLYGKNLLRVIVAFFVWSYVYSFTRINAGPWHMSLSLLLAGPSHLWFLKAIAGLYIAVPLLRAITANRATTRYFLIVAAVATFVVPFVFILCRQHCNTVAVTAVQRFIDALHLRVTAGYAAYFVLGHYLYAYRPVPRRRLIYILGVVAWLVIIGGTIAYSKLVGKPVNWFVNYLTPTVLFLSVAVFVWGTARPVNLQGWWRSFVVQASRLSFGVYLVHQLVLCTALQHGISTAVMHPLLSIPLFTLATVMISYAISWLLSKVPYANRFVI